jgi:hypothetical protein
MAENTMTGPLNIPSWLRKYRERGFRLIFYPNKTKGPIGKDADGWTTKEYPDEAYEEGMNVGVMTGTEIEPGKFLVDLDFDWTDGLPLVKRLLPATGFGFGRTSRTVSHAFFTTTQPTPSLVFKNIDEATIFLEIRGTKTDGSIGKQTMLPPSVHPSGETVEFRADDAIGHDDNIVRHGTLYAIACMFYMHLGHRGFGHDLRLALAAFLGNLELTEEETKAVCESIAEATGNNVQDATIAVHSTFERIRRNEKVLGSGALLKVLGDDGKKILARVREWLGESEFRTDGKDKILANDQENIQIAFKKLGVGLAFDIFSQKPIIKYESYEGPLSDSIRNRIWLTIDRRFGFRPSAEFFDVVLLDTAHQNQVHPVREYLTKLTWDGQPRIDRWLVEYGQAADTEYVRAISSIFLIAAVRRVMHPGCKFDELMVLESQQGLMKSTALRTLCPDDSWFSDDLPLDVDAKQIIERTTGKWIIEAAELSGMRQAQMEHLKALLSRQVDGPVRLAYARLPVEQPRQFVVIGTTNAHTYLTDGTGNRRFWPVRVEGFDISRLKADRDQLWAEAVHREVAGESTRLPQRLYRFAALQQDRRRTDDPWELKIASEWAADAQRVPPDAIWELLGIATERRSTVYQRRINDIMQRLGFRRMSVKDRNGKVVKGWGRGEGQRDPFIIGFDGDAAKPEGDDEMEM